MVKFKYKCNKPTRTKLNGMSPSQFKTFLKRKGFKVSRDFFKTSIAYNKNRAYRFRWWSDSFEVDISCPLNEFDRWANSVDEVLNFYNWSEK